MNKIKLAALVSAAVISSSAMSAEIYKTDTASLSINGRVKAEVLNSYGYLNQTKKSNPDDHPGFIGSARLGVSGESQVNDFFSVFGNVMYDLSAEDNIKDDKRMEIRYAWVGARFGEYGSLLGGHMEPASFRAIKPIHVFGNWGKKGNGTALDKYKKVASSERQDGIIMWKADDLAGFGYSISYRFRDPDSNAQAGVAASVSYDTPIGLGFVGAYNYVKAIDEGKYNTGDRVEGNLGAYWGSHGKPGFYFAGVYDHTRLMSADGISDKSAETKAFNGDGFDLVASYTTPGKLFTFDTGWGYFKNQWADGDKDVVLNQWNAQVRWNVNKQTYIQVEYVDNFAEGPHDTKHNDWLSIGAFYNF